jgi:hypothetical protein
MKKRCPVEQIVPVPKRADAGAPIAALIQKV